MGIAQGMPVEAVNWLIFLKRWYSVYYLTNKGSLMHADLIKQM
jgi:hypothetical protein